MNAEREMPRSADVVVVGSGAGGAAVAGELARRGNRVVVIEAGASGTGAHGRNSDSAYSGTPAFAAYLAGVLRPLNGAEAPPPRLPGLVGIHGVGGMLTGWTHMTPSPDWWELPDWIQRNRWESLLARASDLMHVGTAFSTEDVRFPMFEAIVAERAGALPDGRAVQPMPVAAEASKQGGWRFSGADDLLRGGDANLQVVADHVVRSVVHDRSIVRGVLAYPVGGGDPILVNADAVVIAAGTVGSAQLMSASGLEAGPALGAYLTEHAIIGSRVVLKQNLQRAQEEFSAGAESTGFPPSLWIPTSRTHEWSTTVGSCPWNFNPTLSDDGSIENIIDIVAFCPVEPHESNRLEFDLDVEDAFGLPVATGSLELSTADFETTSDALRELYLLSSDLGDLVDGWSMRMMARGGSLHLMGSCRMGATDTTTSVVSPEGRLWGYDNCYVAGNAVLGERNSSNPTLTTIAFAIHTADAIASSSTPTLVEEKVRQ